MRNFLTLILLAISLQSAPWSPATVDNFTPSLMRGLVAYWKFDEASGTRYDAWTNGYNLTDVNSMQSAAGVLENCATNTGTSYFNGPTNSQLNFTNGIFSGSVWVYFANTNSEWCINAKYSTTGNQRGWWFYYEKALNYMVLNCSTNGVGTQPAINTQLRPVIGAWTHYVYGMNSNILTIYTNGVLAFTNNAGATNYTPFNSTAKFQIGALDGYSTKCVNKVDENGLWNRALKPNEITQLYNVTKARRFGFVSGP